MKVRLKEYIFKMMENQIKSKVKQIKIAMKSNMNSLLIKKCRIHKSKIKQKLFKIKTNKELLKSKTNKELLKNKTNKELLNSRIKHVFPKMLMLLY